MTDSCPVRSRRILYGFLSLEFDHAKSNLATGGAVNDNFFAPPIRNHLPLSFRGLTSARYANRGPGTPIWKIKGSERWAQSQNEQHLNRLLIQR